ncbi:hypothetical protein KM043_012519 [Ampulex compressa]|nr:hypothetical protein KM043_012519 [Ampulex compressa]
MLAGKRSTIVSTIRRKTSVREDDSYSVNRYISCLRSLGSSDSFKSPEAAVVWERKSGGYRITDLCCDRYAEATWLILIDPIVQRCSVRENVSELDFEQNVRDVQPLCYSGRNWKTAKRLGFDLFAEVPYKDYRIPNINENPLGNPGPGNYSVTCMGLSIASQGSPSLVATTPDLHEGSFHSTLSTKTKKKHKVK